MSSEPLIRPGLSTAIKKNLPKIKAKLRAKVPNLALREVQIRTLPYQAILRYDLCANGYLSSLELFDGIIANDGMSFETLKLNELSGDVRDALTKLAEELCAAEDEFDQVDTQAKILLGLALHFEKFYESFPWTTNELYESALNAASKCETGYVQALVQYHYANFLLCKERAFELASIKIQTALELAREKNEKCSISENDESTSLIKSVVLLYFKIFLERARQMTDKQEAQQIAMDVIGMIGDSLDDPMTKARCYYEYGDFLQTNKLFLKAVDAYVSGKGEANKLKDVSLQCKGLFYIASCYKQLNNFIKAEQYVKRLHELAEENQQEVWMAEALLLLAEIKAKSSSEEAIQCAEQALALFQSSPPFTDHQQKLDQARLIAAKLKAEKMYPAYLNSIHQSEMGSRSHFFNLLSWQISRKFLES